MPATILTINSGSSSLKLGLYSAESGQPPRLVYKGAADHIGKPGGVLTIADAEGNTVHREDAEHASQPQAFTHAAQKLRSLAGADPAAIGHRIVHGGPHLREHCRLTADVLQTLRNAMHYAPLHIPPALALIEAVTQQYPRTPQFACFDTAFHTTLPPEAFTYAIPARYRQQGVQRYGFHGLSYESIVAALAPSVPARLVVAHLGNGASLCAIADASSVDTSMGLTPTGGIPMGTRTGDLDPGVVLFLARSGGGDNGGLSTDALETTVNHDSGLSGLSGGTSDMRELAQAADSGNEEAALAIAIFCREIAKTVAAYAAVLGGIDCLVFTGGIGEHSSAVRQQVCRQLAFLGVAIDSAANNAHAKTISADSSKVAARVLPADEDGQIAYHVHALLAE